MKREMVLHRLAATERIIKEIIDTLRVSARSLKPLSSTVAANRKPQKWLGRQSYELMRPVASPNEDGC
jgi:hypothetical protein